MTTTLTLPGRPEIGSKAHVQQQRFECVGLRPHRTRDGRDVQLAVWQAPCADCGAPFQLVTPVRERTVRVDRRRCDAHRRPGSRVKRTGSAAR
jgi:hypothetical protein